MAGIGSFNQTYNYSGISFQNDKWNDNQFSSAPEYTAASWFQPGRVKGGKKSTDLHLKIISDF